MKCLYYIYFDNNDNVTAITKLNTDKIETQVLGSKPQDLSCHSRQLISNSFILSEMIDKFLKYESQNTDKAKRSVANRERGKRFSEQEKIILLERIKNLHENDLSIRQISERLCIPKTTISRLLKQL